MSLKLTRTYKGKHTAFSLPPFLFKFLTGKKTRNIPDKAMKVAGSTPIPARSGEMSEHESVEDDEDLDIPMKSHSHSQSHKPSAPPTRLVSSPAASPPPKASPPPATRAKNRGFQIGGRVGKAPPKSPSPIQENAGATSDAGTLTNHGAVSPSADDDFARKDDTSEVKEDIQDWRARPKQ